MAGSLFQTIQVIVGAVVPGGREGEHALEMAPFCSFSLEEQSADPKPWGTDEEQGNQCRQSSQYRADDAAWKVCPSLFPVVWTWGRKTPAVGASAILSCVLGGAACCWAVVTSAILSW